MVTVSASNVSTGGLLLMPLPCGGAWSMCSLLLIHAAADVMLLPVLVMLLPDKAYITFHLLAAMYSCIIVFDML